ncbi:uncharacterized protein SAPINGB_P003913 [Magnusiomyces paraingens]|uniref:Uncharacterized protein n=1 Tax=Magnusiomyces paraingens TaxID=2606893 RepID=A0A5E8BRX4_9ASCO|nr:uncharacterized protein SAPINGB_P003913 [Saprochaete ingens]VVT54113.1 unnamed protein product [Saprochaete ingens]
MSQDSVRYNYERHITQKIVQLVLVGEIEAHYKDIGEYAQTVFNHPVSQSTMANWFKDAGVTLASIRNGTEKSIETHCQSNNNMVDYFLRAPGVFRTSSNVDLDFMKDIIYIVLARILSGHKLSIKILLDVKYHMTNVFYDQKELEKKCKKFALTYRLPDVDLGIITYEQYLQDVFTNFPSLKP